jgi:hypothetical protein
MSSRHMSLLPRAALRSGSEHYIHTLSQGKKKKGDEVKYEDDDDVVRTSVPQDKVTATLCNEELFLCTQNIQLFHISDS